MLLTKQILFSAACVRLCVCLSDHVLIVTLLTLLKNISHMTWNRGL